MPIYEPEGEVNPYLDWQFPEPDVELVESVTTSNRVTINSTGFENEPVEDELVEVRREYDKMREEMIFLLDFVTSNEDGVAPEDLRRLIKIARTYG